MNTTRRLVSATPLSGALIGLLVCMSASGAWALNHSGTCTGTFAPADNPHVLTGGCSVPAGQTLTIMPGVMLNGQNYTLEVQAGGTLNATGTSAAQRDVQFQNVYITFDGHSGATPAGTGQLANCTVTSDYILITDGSPVITGCTLIVANNIGIELEGSSQAQISGNTITENSNYAGIWVRDTAQPAISGNTITTNGVGLYYQNSSGGTAMGNTIGFLPGGGSGRTGIYAQDSAAPVIDGNTITDDPTESDKAIWLNENAPVAVHVTNNVVHGSGGDVAVASTPNVFGAGAVIMNNQFPAGAAWILGGTVTGAVTIGAVNGQTTYTLTNNLVVANGATLTIPAGITLTGQNYTLEVQAGGTLNATGTSAAQRDVRFQNVYITFDGHSGVTPAGTGHLQNCTVSGDRILITDGSPVIAACTLNTAGVDGIDVEGSSQAQIMGNTITESSNLSGVFVRDTAQPLITGNTIITNGAGLFYQNSSGGTAMGNTIGFLPGGGSGRTGIYAQDSAAPLIDGNTITDDPTESDTAIWLNESAPVAVHVTNNVVHGSGGDVAVASTPNALGAGAVIMNNQLPAGVAWTLRGTVTGAVTLGAVNGQTTYTLTGSLVVANGATLTIPAGITLTGQNNTLEVQAGGTLNATGTSAAQRDVKFQNVYITFDGHSGVTPAGTGQLQNCTVSGDRILIVDGSPVIAACTLNTAGVDGIDVEGSSQAQITGNTITQNSNLSGVFVRDTAQPLITGNTILTNGAGLFYQNSSGGTAMGNTIGFLPGGGSGRTAIYAQDSAAPVIDGNTITEDPAESDTAIWLNESAPVAVHVTNNVVHGSGGDVAVASTPNALGAGAVIMNNQLPAGVAWTLRGTVTGAVTLGAVNGQTTYTLTSSLVVANGATLTIPAGITLTGQNNTLEVQAGGTLNATGTSAAQRDVRFQNVYITFDGHSGVTPAGTGQLQNCTVSGDRILIVDGSPVIAACTLNTAGVDGIDVEGSSQAQITGNSITENSTLSGVFVRDTAQPLITGNTIVTNGTGLYYQNSSGGTAMGNTISFLPGAGYARWGISLQDNAAPVIDSNTVLDDTTDSDIALRLQENAGVAVHVTNNVVHGSGGDVAVAATPNTFGAGSVITGNQFPAGRTWTLGGTVTGAASVGVVNGQTKYVLTSGIVVTNGATLTIPAGVTLVGQNNGLEVQAGGTLSAMGTSAAQRDVQFQNLYITFDGHNGVTPAATGQLANCTITGPNGYNLISISDGMPSVKNCTITGGATAIRITSTAQPVITGNTVASVSTGIDISGSGTAQVSSNTFQGLPIAIYVHATTSRSTVADNTFDRNSASLVFDAEATLFSAFPEMFDANMFMGSAENFIVLPSSLHIATGGTLDPEPVPYLASGLTINQGATLFLSPGVMLANTSYSIIQVNGDLVADASQSPDRPIVFSAQSPKSGTPWGGIVFSGQAAAGASTLSNAIIEFGGAGSQPALALNGSSININSTTVTASAATGLAITNGASPQITGTTVTLSAGDGVQISSASHPVFVDTSILRNSGFGMTNKDCSVVHTAIAATNIYWGDDSGPQASTNPNGQGNKVSDCLTFDPWIRIGPSKEGTLAALSGGSQSGAPGSILPQPLVVRVTSTLGTPLSGVSVTFSAAGGGVQIETEQPVTTDANGQASAIVRLGPEPGPNGVAVTARDVNSPLATFAVQGASNNAAELFALRALSASRMRAGDGDVNGDGRVDNLDAALIEAELSGRVPPDEDATRYFTAQGDINGDGVVDRGDELVILNRLVKRESISSLETPSVATTSPPSGRRVARVRLRRPRVTPVLGETFRVPVEVFSIGGDPAAYAFAVQYDRRKLELLAIDGGTAPGFDQSPVINHSTFRHGHARFAAVNRGLLKTNRRMSVAILVFRARATGRTQIGLAGGLRLAVSTLATFENEALRATHPVAITVR